MKKFILSIFVMVSFGFYVIWQNVANSSNNFLTPVVDTNTVGKIPKHTISIPTASIVNKPQPTSVASLTPITTSSPSKKIGIYNDGTYIGSSADAYYGYVQAKAVITNGRLTDVVILDYPQDRNTSIRINSRALPILVREAIVAQSANVDGVSGASATSPAFMESLTSALNQAKV